MDHEYVINETVYTSDSQPRLPASLLAALIDPWKSNKKY